MIGILDYGLGNIKAFVNIYRRLQVPACVVRSPAQIKDVDKLILPGVGAFDWAIDKLSQSGLRHALEEAVLEKGYPILGVCVGMHMMGRKSEEGGLAGLGWIDGVVKQFNRAHGICLPHMGWNDVYPLRNDGIFKQLETPRFYFLHSYFFVPKDESTVVGRSEYGGHFASAIAKGHIYGVQFHPEKSHHWGIRLLANFSEI